MILSIVTKYVAAAVIKFYQQMLEDKVIVSNKFKVCLLLLYTGARKDTNGILQHLSLISLIAFPSPSIQRIIQYIPFPLYISFQLLLRNCASFVFMLLVIRDRSLFTAGLVPKRNGLGKRNFQT